MNALRNKVLLIGNLGGVPEIKTTEGGKKLAKFSMATNETYKNNQGEKVTDTQWHNLVAWERVADLAERFLEKGSEVVVEGRLVNRNYLDKDGVRKSSTEIHVSEMLLIGKRAVV
ncbi:MAG: single-stranded DNA-binding protein [Ferruginibacter sp.]|nr:single-stranded DNA-binding protein [Ferruginibacter sp.]